MHYRRLGRTDLKVSLICLGTMTWGQQNTEAEGHAQMDYALDRGVNFFDTAEMYSIPPKAETQGSTERIIGTWFKSRGTRDKVILASKVAGRSENTWLREGEKPTEVSRDQIVEAVEGSLRRLQTDWIDLYQIHWPDRPMAWGSNPTIYRHKEGAAHPIEEQLEAMDRLVRAGKIRHVGLSNESAWGTMSFLKLAETAGLPRVQSPEHGEAGARSSEQSLKLSEGGLPRVQSVQNAYNLVSRTYETALAEISMREQVSLLAYSPLGQGYLTGKYLGGARPPGARTTLFQRGQRYETPGAEPAIAQYVALARELGIDPAQLAIAFVNSRPFTTSTIIGATSMAHLKTNIGSVDVTITPEIEERIDAIHLRNANPCP